MKRIRMFVWGVCVGVIPWGAHAVLINEQKVIRAPISFQHLNTLRVKNGQIEKIVGLDGAFHSEKNEKNGDIFLRPTEENGYADIDLKIITTSGHTQDVLLKVQDGEPQTLELEDSPEESSLFEDRRKSFEGIEENVGSAYEEALIAVMKQLMLRPSNYPKKSHDDDPDRSRGPFKVRLQAAYDMEGWTGLIYTLTLKEPGSFPLKETMFSQKGDRVLSLSSFVLEGQNTVTLFVIRR